MTYFEWNDSKDRSNRAKHGISFMDAVQIFDDPLYRLTFDSVVNGEERWHAFGVTDASMLLLVVHTSREEDGDERIRIISARRATRKERATYEGR